MAQLVQMAVDIRDAQPARPANRILLGLPASEFARLAPQLERVVLPQNFVLQPADEEIEHVYFPVRGVASLLVNGSEGEQVDTAIVGNEGMVGLPVFLGTGRMPVQAVVQVSMEAQRLRATDLRTELRRGGELVNILQRYSQMVVVELAQLILCNRAHSLERRTARWILQINDRLAASAPLAVTQDFLASMLGANRPKVTAVLQSLRAAGLVTYTRGNLQVRDASALESHACACYRTIRDELDRLLATTERHDITATR
jgi:CRP-like cAMP-binding protein